MHIPDGYLDLWICLVTYFISISYGVSAYRYFLRRAEIEHVVLISNLAAVVFVAQMLNWPLPGGTSIHFIGGALAGIVLGPFLGFLVIFLVLLVQLVLFHDGGVTTFGANLLNMGIVDVFVGFVLFSLVAKRNSGTVLDERKVFVGGFLGGWFGMFLAGVVAGLQLGLSTNFIYGLSVAIPVMGVYHFVLGVIEGVITGIVCVYLVRRGYKLPLVGDSL